jgi:pimeloyl-ACP methyl ester carboxylesterase
VWRNGNRSRLKICRAQALAGSSPATRREAQQATACPDTVLRMLDALIAADLGGKLPGLRAKLLLMHPDDSPFIPVAVMASLRDLVPDARLHVIGHARHGLPFSHATICARLLASFIKEQAG